MKQRLAMVGCYALMCAAFALVWYSRELASMAEVLR